MRSNLVIALGDLAFRFPNLLEPWTERIYGPLSDPDTGQHVMSEYVFLSHGGNRHGTCQWTHSLTCSCAPLELSYETNLWVVNVTACVVHPGVRKNSLMVLTHLIMNDMRKVKGPIARMALCLQDPQPRIKALAHRVFHELAQKNYKVWLGLVTR